MNKIRDASFLAGCTSLSTVDLRNTYLTTIDFCKNLNIASLYIDSTNVESVRCLWGNTSIVHMYFRNSPNIPVYEGEVIRNMANLNYTNRRLRHITLAKYAFNHITLNVIKTHQ